MRKARRVRAVAGPRLVDFDYCFGVVEAPDAAGVDAAGVDAEGVVAAGGG